MRTRSRRRAGADGPGAAAPPAHAAVAILLLHYLLTADGTPPAETRAAYRELPDGLFYAATFAARAEEPLTRAFAGPAPQGPGPAGLDAFRDAARRAGGDALTLGDASFRFVALPRLDVVALVWAGDDEEPGEARVLFDASAGHYLPAEDRAGLGGRLAYQLVAAARAQARLADGTLRLVGAGYDASPSAPQAPRAPRPTRAPSRSPAPR